MMFSSLSGVRWVALLIATSSALCAADLADTIVKARGYLGPEGTLDGVHSVHFVGTLATDDNRTATIEIIFQKPYRQRIVTSSVERREITALDDYEGWQRIEDPKDPARWRMNLLSKDQVKRLRSNTLENLSFFRGIERRGGRIEDLGIVDVNGRSANKVSFIHDSGSVFTRYFDETTGKLILTETEQGGSIREDGEILANGLRFPKKIVTISKTEGGKERSVSIEFQTVTVNEAFADELFAVPQIVPPPPRSK